MCVCADVCACPCAGLLVSRAPALTHVSVGWLSPTLSDFSAKQWALQSLTLTSQEVQPSVRDLVKLPKSTHDRVDITCAYGHISFHTGAEVRCAAGLFQLAPALHTHTHTHTHTRTRTHMASRSLQLNMHADRTANLLHKACWSFVHA